MSRGYFLFPPFFFPQGMFFSFCYCLQNSFKYSKTPLMAATPPATYTDTSIPAQIAITVDTGITKIFNVSMILLNVSFFIFYPFILSLVSQMLHVYNLHFPQTLDSQLMCLHQTYDSGLMGQNLMEGEPCIHLVHFDQLNCQTNIVID